MGTISQKLEYLNTTKGKIKDSINITGANIGTNDTFRSYSTKLRDGLVNVINDGGKTLYNNFPKVTGSGSDITLNNTYQSPIKIDLKGNTYQASDPTPSSPQDIKVVTGYNNIAISDGTESQNYEVNLGKNLLPINISSGTTNNGVTITKLEDGSYSLNGTSTTGFTWDLYNGDDITIPAGTYTGSIGNITNIGGCYIRKNNGDYQTIAESTTSNTFTINNTFTFNRMYIYVHNNRTFNNQIIKPMLEEGSKVTPYSPYKTPIELCNIGEYTDEIRKSTGKNLFDKDNPNVINGYANSTGNVITGSTSGIKTIYVSCQPNTTYTISKALSPTTASNRFRLATTNVTPENGVTISDYVDYSDGTTNTSLNITTGATAKYLVATIYYPDTLMTFDEMLATIQIEEGSQATDLEPYGTGIYYKYSKIDKYKLLSTDLLSIEGQNTTNGYIVCSFPNKINNSLMKCNCLSQINLGASEDNSNKIGFHNINTQNRIRIRLNTGLLDLDNSKTWINNNETWFYYPLSTPTVTILDDELQNQLNELENANSYTGVTNIIAEYISGNQPFDMSASALLKE